MTEKIRVNYDIPTFTIVPHWVADLVKPTELAAFVVLGKYADNVTKECWPSLNTIAKDLGRSKTATISAIKGLEDKGVLKITKRRNTKGDWDRNHYTLIINEGSKENLTTPSKENITTGSSENLTLTRPNITKPIELYNKKIQNSYKDVIVKVCSLQKITQNMWGQIERTAKQLFEAGVTVEEIPTLAQNIVLSYGESALTHRSLVNHTELIQGAKTRKPKDFKKALDQNNLERWANEQ
jgi:hypothetical protein